MTECVFCQRIRDGWYDETSKASVVSFEPLNPVTPGHRLFVPVDHVEDAATKPGTTALTFAAASQWGGGRAESFNLITSAGTSATQTVFHLHVHYVPRRRDDGLTLPWTGQEKRLGTTSRWSSRTATNASAAAWTTTAKGGPPMPESAAFPPIYHDPWDKRMVRFPVGLLATLLYLAERADDEGVVPECDADPCSFCTAMQDAESVMNRYDIRVEGHR